MLDQHPPQPQPSASKAFTTGLGSTTMPGGIVAADRETVAGYKVRIEEGTGACHKAADDASTHLELGSTCSRALLTSFAGDT